MNDLVQLIGYFVTAAVVILVSVIVLDRYWGTSLLRGLVKPKQPLFYEGRPWWTKEPLKFQVLGLPVVVALFLYDLILDPERLALLWPILIMTWTPSLVSSLFALLGGKTEIRSPDM